MTMKISSSHPLSPVTNGNINKPKTEIFVICEKTKPNKLLT